MPITLGFNLEDVVDPRAKTEFAQFVSALQLFLASFTFKEIPFDATNVFTGLPGTSLQNKSEFYQFSYRVVGDVMDLSFNLMGLATSGGQFLFIRIPDGYVVGPYGLWPQVGWATDNGAYTTTFIQARQGESFLRVLRSDIVPWTNTGGAFTSQLSGQISFRVVQRGM